MKFVKTKINGCYIIEFEKHEDNRGFLARTWDKAEFAKNGINFDILEGYITLSKKKGTLRGLHFLKADEQKITKVLSGSVYELILDINPDSPTFKRLQAFTFKSTDPKSLFMGPGIAHAILSLEDNTELMSLYSPAYKSGNEGGIRFNDPSFNFSWPLKIEYVSEKDMSWEDFN